MISHSLFMLIMCYYDLGDLVKGVEHLETFHKLAHKHKWHTDSGDSLHEISCEHLRRVYTKLAAELTVSVYHSSSVKL